MDIKSPFGKNQKGEVDLEFPIEIPQSSWGMTQGLRNSRILVIASEAKQSLGILDRKVIIFYTFSLSLQITSS